LNAKFEKIKLWDVEDNKEVISVEKFGLDLKEVAKECYDMSKKYSTQ